MTCSQKRAETAIQCVVAWGIAVVCSIAVFGSIRMGMDDPELVRGLSMLPGFGLPVAAALVLNAFVKWDKIQRRTAFFLLIGFGSLLAFIGAVSLPIAKDSPDVAMAPLFSVFVIAVIRVILTLFLDNGDTIRFMASEKRGFTCSSCGSHIMAAEPEDGVCHACSDDVALKC